MLKRSGLFTLLVVVTAWPCVLPVFRYALERWAQEPYLTVVFHRGALSPADSQTVESLRQMNLSKFTNVEIVTADVDSMSDEYLKTVWEQQPKEKLPWTVMLYPGEMMQGRIAWAGVLDDKVIEDLTASPSRRELWSRIRRGQSAVFLLVESGDRGADKKARKRIERHLRKLNKELKLSEITEENRPGWFDPEAGPALKVTFSVLTISPRDKREAMFVAMLKGSLDSVEAAGSGPWAFPVFGQARCLGGISAANLSDERLASVCSFIVGECACTVKEMNPGFDLLTSVDWTDLEQQPLPDEEPLPPLAGIGGFVDAAQNNPADEAGWQEMASDTSGAADGQLAPPSDSLQGASGADRPAVLFTKSSRSDTVATDSGIFSSVRTSILMSLGLVLLVSLAGAAVVIRRRRS